MARPSKETTQKFIDTIAPAVIRNCIVRGYFYPSAIIAQAVHECSYGNNVLIKYNNFWGMKAGKDWTGDKVDFGTWEDRNKNGKRDENEGTHSYFRTYKSVNYGVNGYFDKIDCDRYKVVRNAENPANYLKKIAAAGWATDANYASKIIPAITDFKLTDYDVAMDVIRGKYGKVADLDYMKRLEKAGYDPLRICKIVTHILKHIYDK